MLCHGFQIQNCLNVHFTSQLWCLTECMVVMVQYIANRLLSVSSLISKARLIRTCHVKQWPTPPSITPTILWIITVAIFCHCLHWGLWISKFYINSAMTLVQGFMKSLSFYLMSPVTSDTIWRFRKQNIFDVPWYTCISPILNKNKYVDCCIKGLDWWPLHHMRGQAADRRTGRSEFEFV
jgi:hypothetical protein